MRGEKNVYKRGRVYWICYWHRGKRYRESAKTDNEREARQLYHERRADTGRGKTAAITGGKVTFEQMAEAYLNDYRDNNKRTLDDAENAVRHLKGFFGRELAVDIKTLAIRAFSRAKKADSYANASINRYLAALQRMFNLLIHDGVLESAPYVPMLEENNARQGTVEPGDFQRLLECLPGHLKNPVEFLYRSAWRVGEMRKLEWRDINLTALEISLRPENSKNKKRRVVPLRGKLLEVIERARAQRRLDCVFVFHNNREPIGDFRKAWRTACNAAGLGKLLVHDLRRSGITNMRRAGIAETTAMRVSGHKTSSTFRRYQIEATRDIEEGLDRLDAYLEREADKAKVEPLTATEPPQIHDSALKEAV
jgi:integrase